MAAHTDGKKKKKKKLAKSAAHVSFACFLLFVVVSQKIVTPTSVVPVL